MEVIVEDYINFDYEITLLTLTQNNGNTLFCPPIGHRQERGDYQESWQPMTMKDVHLKLAQEMANKVTKFHLEEVNMGSRILWEKMEFISLSYPQDLMILGMVTARRNTKLFRI